MRHSHIFPKKMHTQHSQDAQHLCIQLPIQLKTPTKLNRSLKSTAIDDSKALQTNFNCTVNNPYAFILLHLRNRSDKNIINVNIPEVCVFVDRVPYDIVYSKNGYIRGVKNVEQPRVRLKEVYRVFKDNWVVKNISKMEQCVAAFAEKQMLMLSENDLYLVCCKNKADPFFKKLRYIKNKLPTSTSNNNPPLISQYPALPLPLKQGQLLPQQINYLKLATESLMGFKNQTQIKNSLSEQAYLNFINAKISLFLNYQHNIRLHKATFIYTKNNENQYYLIDIHDIVFDNLTKSLNQRKKMLKKKEEERQKILIISPDRQEKYRKKFGDNVGEIRNYQEVMTNQFNSIVRRLDLNTIDDNRREEIKNQLAFKRLHPRSKFTYNQVVTSKNFLKIKNQVFNISNRQELTIPSRHVMKFYNQVRHSNKRVKTEGITVVKY